MSTRPGCRPSARSEKARRIKGQRSLASLPPATGLFWINFQARPRLRFVRNSQYGTNKPRDSVLQQYVNNITGVSIVANARKLHALPPQCRRQAYAICEQRERRACSSGSDSYPSTPWRFPALNESHSASLELRVERSLGRVLQLLLSH